MIHSSRALLTHHVVRAITASSKSESSTDYRIIATSQVVLIPLQEAAIVHHYKGRGKILISESNSCDVLYEFDYDRASGAKGFVWDHTEVLVAPASTALRLRLENSDQCLPVRLSSCGYDPAHKMYQFSLS